MRAVYRREADQEHSVDANEPAPSSSINHLSSNTKVMPFSEENFELPGKSSNNSHLVKDLTPDYINDLECSRMQLLSENFMMKHTLIGLWKGLSMCLPSTMEHILPHNTRFLPGMEFIGEKEQYLNAMLGIRRVLESCDSIIASGRKSEYNDIHGAPGIEQSDFSSFPLNDINKTNSSNLPSNSDVKKPFSFNSPPSTKIRLRHSSNASRIVHRLDSPASPDIEGNSTKYLNKNFKFGSDSLMGFPVNSNENLPKCEERKEPLASDSVPLDSVSYFADVSSGVLDSDSPLRRKVFSHTLPVRKRFLKKSHSEDDSQDEMRWTVKKPKKDRMNYEASLSSADETEIESPNLRLKNKKFSSKHLYKRPKRFTDFKTTTSDETPALAVEDCVSVKGDEPSFKIPTNSTFRDTVIKKHKVIRLVMFDKRKLEGKDASEVYPSKTIVTLSSVKNFFLDKNWQSLINKNQQLDSKKTGDKNVHSNTKPGDPIVDFKSNIVKDVPSTSKPEEKILNSKLIDVKDLLSNNITEEQVLDIAVKNKDILCTNEPEEHVLDLGSNDTQLTNKPQEISYRKSNDMLHTNKPEEQMLAFRSHHHKEMPPISKSEQQILDPNSNYDKGIPPISESEQQILDPNSNYDKGIPPISKSEQQILDSNSNEDKGIPPISKSEQQILDPKSNDGKGMPPISKAEQQILDPKLISVNVIKSTYNPKDEIFDSKSKDGKASVVAVQNIQTQERKSDPLSELDETTWVDRLISQSCKRSSSKKLGMESNTVEGDLSDQENKAPEVVSRKRKQDCISEEWDVDTKMRGKRRHSESSK